MSKLKGFFILFLLSFCLLGCSDDTTKNFFDGDPIYLASEHYSSDKAFIDITKDNWNIIEKATDNKENIIFYVHLTSCTTCATFGPMLEKYLKDNNMMCYRMSYNGDMKELLDEFVDFKIYTPTVVIIKDGEAFTYLDPMSNEHTEVFKSQMTLKSWIESYIYPKSSNE